jgi:MoaA/NifB/PqqE/SkfB family radical SAM enzyme
MKIKPSEGNKTFCIVPWTHTYLSPQSERRMCCASREKASWITQYIDSIKADNNSDYKPLTLDEHWNSPYMMDVRKRLMAGEEISQCMVCNDKVLNFHVYRDYFNKTLFPNKIEEAFLKTDDDGYTEMKPISFDYRITNLCNFKCRMCGDLLSSSWETERKSMGDYEDGKEPWAQKENKAKIEKFQIEVAEKELWDAVKSGHIEEIYWVGGEPLVWDIHWDIMNYLVNSGGAKNVVIRYNTNLSHVRFKGNNLYDLLPSFKNVQLCASIDGVGSDVEYIRHGISWNNWLSNFKEGLFLNKQFGKYGISFDLTVTSMGLFSIKEMIDLTAELDVYTLIKTTYAFDSKIIMSPLMMPRHILEPILDDIIKYARKKSIINPKIYNYVICFEDIKNKKTFEEEYLDWHEGLIEGKKRMLKIDTFRNNTGMIEKIFAKCPPLFEWWNSIPIN